MLRLSLSRVARRCVPIRKSSELLSRLGNPDIAHRIALIDDHTKESYTYGELVSASATMAAALAEKLPKHSVAVGGFNKSSSSLVVTMLAAWRLQKMFVPLCSTHSESELSYFAADSKLGAIVCSSASDITPAFVSALKIPLIESKTLDLKGGITKATPVSPSVATEDWDALVVYTSGTTGRPKGVVHGSHGLTSMMQSLVQSWQYSDSDAILHFLPLYHVHGLVNKLLCMLWVGARVEFLESGKADLIWRRLASESSSGANSKHPLTLFMAVPTIYAKMLESVSSLPADTLAEALATIKKLRLTVCGSAALPDSVMYRWRELTGHTLLERYGMTEIGMALTNPYAGERRMGTVGQPFPGVECRLVDEEGRTVNGHSTPGELWIKGPTVFKRYLNLPQVTQDSFGEPGWFKTGDIAEVSPDGYYKILGRNSTDIIKSSGYKISALEIERELLDHYQIAEAAVIGVPDDVLGEKIVSVISLFKHTVSPPATGGFPNLTGADKKLLSAGLKEFLSHRLAQYKQPRDVVLVEAIPRNHLGKVNKKSLAKELGLK